MQMSRPTGPNMGLCCWSLLLLSAIVQALVPDTSNAQVYNSILNNSATTQNKIDALTTTSTAATVITTEDSPEDDVWSSTTTPFPSKETPPQVEEIWSTTSAMPVNASINPQVEDVPELVNTTHTSEHHRPRGDQDSLLSNVSDGNLSRPIVDSKNNGRNLDDDFDVIDPYPTDNRPKIITTKPTKSTIQLATPKKVDKEKTAMTTMTTTTTTTKAKSSKLPGLFYWERPSTTNSGTTAAAISWDNELAGFCMPTFCPRFRTLERRKHYDVRYYHAHRWASTILMTSERVLAELEGYTRLQGYFNGQNEKGTIMNMTVPLLTQIKFGKHPGVLREMNDITISMMIPLEKHKEVPAPYNSDILIDSLDAGTVFVQQFQARVWEVNDKVLRSKTQRFMAQLRAHGEAFYDRYVYLASYSKMDMLSPLTFELWIHATRFRDPKRVKPRIPSRDPPFNRLTARTKKKLCRGVECPAFDVLRVYKFGIQKRRYFDSVFASASSDDCEFSNLSVWKGFMPLHLYKHGLNSHLEALEATRPIGIVHVQNRHAGSNNNCKQNMTLSLYLPHRLHSNPPVAGSGAPSVRITRFDDLIVYVQTVGGFLLDPTRTSQEVRDFEHRLTELGLCFVTGQYYIVIYDYVVRFHGRQNEIWLLADTCPPSNNSTEY